jgi:lactate dehydrogenase-like 2-hydroxyacid dehydrogenase
MIFRKITIIDPCGLTDPETEKISLLSKEKITAYNDVPGNDDEIINRIGDSDCILVSWRTRISAETLRAAPSLKYVGMCCSLYNEKAANVDIASAKQLGITVRGVRDYGDEGTVEYIFAQLIYLFKGLGKIKWRSESTELKGKSIGIIGLGTLGKMVSKTAFHFGMKGYYFSRNRNYALEKKGITFLPMNELLESCDIISTHLPKNTIVLTEKEFKIKKPNSVLVNTSLGLTFEKEPFLKWITSDKTSFAIFDSDGAGNFRNEFSAYENIVLSTESAGFTAEARKRLSEKVLLNLKDYTG